MLKLAIIGAGGRMGRTLLEAAQADARVVVAAATEHPDSPLLGNDTGALIGAPASGVTLSADLPMAIDAVDVAIDFTRPDSSLATARCCAEQGKRAVIGTTGLSPGDRERLRELARRAPVVFAPNMSVGVNLLLQLLDTAARVLGDDYDVEIVEAHHRHKVDAPSGTALRIGEVLAQALGRDLAACAVYGREGQIGERDSRTIGFATVRGGDIVGEHTVMFAGTGERIEISHRASSRMTFARGALRAAWWLRDRPPGLFGMHDVLNFA